MSRRALSAVLLACCAWHGAAAAACTRAVKVAASAMGADMTIDEQRKVSGIVADLLSEVAQRSGCAFDYLPVPRVRGIKMFIDGEVDLLTSAVQTTERDQVGRFIPFTSARVAALTLRRRQAAIGEPDGALSGSYVVNVVRGYDYGPHYRALLASLQHQHRLEEVVDPLTAMRKLAMGRADVVLIAPGAAVDAAAQAGVGDRLQATPILSIPAFFAGVYVSRASLGARDHAALVRALEAPELRQQYWNAAKSSTPAWALAGARPVR